MSRLSITEIGERVLKEESLYPSEEDNFIHHMFLQAEQGGAELEMGVLIHPFYQFVVTRASWLNFPVSDFFPYFVFRLADFNEDKAMLILAVAKVIHRRRDATKLLATEFISYYNGNVIDPEVIDTFLSDPEVVETLHTPSAWSV